MGEFKHLAIVKFKEGVVVKDILKGVEKAVSEIDCVKYFEWGQAVEGDETQEMRRQGFTHALLMTFNNKEDYKAFDIHPKHTEFAATFLPTVEKIVVVDFPTVLVKATAK